MYLHDSILWAVGPDGVSGINILCDSSKSEEVAKFFEETFEKHWADAEDAVEEEYGDCYEKDMEEFPVGVYVVETGVKVVFDALTLSYADGDRIVSDEYSDKALDKTLDDLLKTYPEVSYEGYIGFSWSDINGGDVTQYAISSKKD